MLGTFLTALVVIVVVVIGAIAIAAIWSCVACCRAILRDGRASFVRIPDPACSHPTEHQRTVQLNGWADQHGFAGLGSFECTNGGFYGVWKHCQHPTILYLQGVPYPKEGGTFHSEFVTAFNNDVSLSTSMNSAGNLFPKRPGRYVQTFHGADLDELHEHHLSAKAMLMHVGRLSFGHIDLPFEGGMEQGSREALAFIRSIPFWPIRTPYWLFTRPERWNGLTIEQQHRRGWIRLPGEIAELTDA